REQREERRVGGHVARETGGGVDAEPFDGALGLSEPGGRARSRPEERGIVSETDVDGVDESRVRRPIAALARLFGGIGIRSPDGSALRLRGRCREGGEREAESDDRAAGAEAVSCHPEAY